MDSGAQIWNGSPHIPSYHSSMGKQKTFVFITGGQEGKKAGTIISPIANHTSPVMNLSIHFKSNSDLAFYLHLYNWEAVY